MDRGQRPEVEKGFLNRWKMASVVGTVSVLQGGQDAWEKNTSISPGHS